VSNILFALYHDFSANSAVHVHNFANQLTALGHSTAVAVPADEDRGAGFGEQLYAVSRFDQIDGDWSRLFANGEPPDIVHAWTPRENVRLFCEKIAGFCAFTLLVHLEDNEEVILEVNLGTSFQNLAASSSAQFPGNLSHPRHYRAFLSSADGVTMIMDRLDRFVPPEIPKLVLWPGADTKTFFPRTRDPQMLGQLGLTSDMVVLCYTGNVHSANARDVRSIYLAAAILDREGTPARLIRTGRDFCSFLGPDEEWAYKVSIELGHVGYQEIPGLLSLADVLVQPGQDNAFNAFRLPGKLPEFFAMGRPVILPRTNVGRFVHHREDAWVLEKVDALGIVDTVLELRRDKALSDRLASGALRFASQNFNWARNTRALAAFYEQIAASRPKESRHVSTVASS
jgi:glycosyltransferase involved in cell wall biosynthesis